MSSHPPAHSRARGAAAGAVAAAAAAAIAWSASSLGEPPHRWVVVAVLVGGAGFGATIDDVRDSIGTPGVLPLAVVAAAAATYGCVPETDQMTEIGITAALVVVVELVIRRPLPSVWHGATSALVLWAGLYGATGRQSALLGALFACTIIPLLGVVLAIAPHFAHVTEAWRWIVLACGAISASAMARTGGIAPSSPGGTITALRWLAIWVAVDVIVCASVVVVALHAAHRSADTPL